MSFQEKKDATSGLLPMQTSVGVGTIEVDSDDQFLITKCLNDSMHCCTQCLLLHKAKYICTVSTAKQRTLYICDDNCLNAFKEDHPGKVVTRPICTLVKNLTAECSTPNNVTTGTGVSIRKCAECSLAVSANEGSTLSWEAMEFCNDDCLCKYVYI